IDLYLPFRSASMDPAYLSNPVQSLGRPKDK
ncbi:MAG: hypothetical protein QOJ17_1650, partial [Rhodospirillaceae bacterium]|nr:hypothetical protein [Rhodospirillaceae bacterium]